MKPEQIVYEFTRTINPEIIPIMEDIEILNKKAEETLRTSKRLLDYANYQINNRGKSK